MHEADFSKFGFYGPDFQSLHDDVWAEVATVWKTLGSDLPDIDQAVDFVYNRSASLFRHTKARLLETEELSPGEFHRMWEELCVVFRPPLDDAWEMSYDLLDPVSLGLMSVVKGITDLDRFWNRKVELDRTAAFGAFREDEMTWLLANHRRILEIGAGTGYFANQFHKRGATSLPWTTTSTVNLLGEKCCLGLAR